MHPSTPGISENEPKKGEHFQGHWTQNIYETIFFDLQKFNILFIDLARFFTKKFYLGGLDT